MRSQHHQAAALPLAMQQRLHDYYRSNDYLRDRGNAAITEFRHRCASRPLSETVRSTPGHQSKVQGSSSSSSASSSGGDDDGGDGPDPDFSELDPPFLLPDPPSFLNFPFALRSLDRWVVWKYTKDKSGRDTKPPYVAKPGHPKYGQMADKTMQSHQTTFENATTAFATLKMDGIGYCFAPGDPYFGIDLDGCLDKATGAIEQEAAAIIAEFPGAYWEISPSGTGVHGIGRGKKPEGVGSKRPGTWKQICDKNPQIEIYDGGDAYFTVTGQKLEGTESDVEDCQAALNALCASLWSQKAAAAPVEAVHADSRYSDEDVCEGMFGATNGAKVRALWDGDTSDYGGDHSAADLALASHLAFWTCKNAEQMDRLFRQSKLIRPKWDERHGTDKYGEHTINVAIDRCDKVRQPKRKSSGSGITFGEMKSAQSIVDATFAPLVWLVAKILTGEGLAVLADRPKRGKSWLVLQLAIAVATGRPFLDKFITSKSRVLYFALEDSDRRIKERLKVVQADSAALENITFNDKFRMNPESIIALESELALARESGRPYGLLIIDTFLKACPPRNGKVDPVRADYNEMATLQDLARKHRCGVLVVHHTRKPNPSSGQALDDLIGTTGATAAPDTILSLATTKDGERVFSAEGKDVSLDTPLELAFDKGAIGKGAPPWTLVGPYRGQLTENQAAVLEALEEKPDRLCDLAKRMDKSESSLSKLLHRMAMSSLVETKDNGEWHAVEYPF